MPPDGFRRHAIIDERRLRRTPMFLPRYMPLIALFHFFATPLRAAFMPPPFTLMAYYA